MGLWRSNEGRTRAWGTVFLHSNVSGITLKIRTDIFTPWIFNLVFQLFFRHWYKKCKHCCSLYFCTSRRACLPVQINFNAFHKLLELSKKGGYIFIAMIETPTADYSEHNNLMFTILLLLLLPRYIYGFSLFNFRINLEMISPLGL